MNSAHEGTIKFDCRWQQAELGLARVVALLNASRAPLRRLGLIGTGPDGISFGNISLRIDDSPEFLISGSGTGALELLTDADVAKVTAFDFAANSVTCVGPRKPSSESLTHAAFYAANREICGVVHIHHELLWSRLNNVLPTTSPSVSFGTPQLAQEVSAILRKTDLARSQVHGAGLIIAGGHRPGLFAFGLKLEEAVRVVMREYTLINVSGIV